MRVVPLPVLRQRQWSSCSKAYSAIWGPKRLVTAPRNLLQGKLKNRIWYYNSAHWKNLKVKSTAWQCLHDWSQVVTVWKQRTKKMLLIQNKESIKNACVSGKIQYQNTVDCVWMCVCALQLQIWSTPTCQFDQHVGVLLINTNVSTVMSNSIVQLTFQHFVKGCLVQFGNCIELEVQFEPYLLCPCGVIWDSSWTVVVITLWRTSTLRALQQKSLQHFLSAK